MALARFLVEVVPPEMGWEALQETTARARGAAAEMRAEGRAVRLVRSVFAPEDRTCFFLYEAPSLDAVEEVVRRADLRMSGEPALPIHASRAHIPAERRRRRLAQLADEAPSRRGLPSEPQGDRRGGGGPRWRPDP